MAIDTLSRGAPDGTRVGQSAADLLSYYATSAPVAQPSGAAQAALSRGQQAGSISVFSSAQSPALVAAITAAEQALTIQSGTGAAMLLAAGDLCYINKPTAQAGLGIGNLRVTGSNTLGVNFNNFSGAGITPTGAQAYGVVAIRGLPVLSAVLSPASVAANSTVEQQFVVTGLAAGSLVQVSKPTAQAGLDIVGCRVVSANLLGITFTNPTAVAILPTASETYSVITLFGLDATNNDMVFSYNAGAIGVIGAGLVVTGAPITFTGALATDVPVGAPTRPTAQAAAANAAFPAFNIVSANLLTAFFVGIGTGATPTASEVYNQKVNRLNPAAPLLNYSQSLAPVSVGANTTAEQTFTVTGLVAGSAVWVNKPSAQNGLGIVGVRVSAVNTLAITYSNSSGAPIVPATETYVIGNFQALLPGAGNVVIQGVAAALDRAAILLAKIRTDMVAMSMLAGA